VYSLNRDRLAFTSRMSIFGGQGRVRTDDFLLAKQALSQLSYKPTFKMAPRAGFEPARRHINSVLPCRLATSDSSTANNIYVDKRPS
jgi:hypothetical protein